VSSLVSQVSANIITPSNSMSHEFYQVMVGSPTILTHSWKQLALWSLEHSCLKKEEQKRCKEIFKRSWNEFCEMIVRDYPIFLEDGSLNEEKVSEIFTGMRLA
jgi:adenosine deaminase CECR1